MVKIGHQFFRPARYHIVKCSMGAALSNNKALCLRRVNWTVKVNTVEDQKKIRISWKALVAAAVTSMLLMCCNNPRDEQVEGLIKLREAKRGRQAQVITIEAAKPSEDGLMIYYNFSTMAPELRKRRDSILVARTLNGNYREIP